MANLVTLKEYKDYAQVSSTENDNRIKGIISYTSDLVKLYCNRTFIDNYSGSAFTDIVEYWEGGNTHYNTKEFPIDNVTKVEVSYDFGTTYTELTLGVDYAVDRKRDSVYIPMAKEYESVNAYKITYTGGYAATPDSLKLVVLDLIDYYVRQEANTKRQERAITIEYVNNADFPSHIRRVLDLYRAI